MPVRIIEERSDQLSFYELKDSARVVKTIAKSAIVRYKTQEWKVKATHADSSALADVIVFKKDTSLLPVAIVEDGDTLLQYYLLTDQAKNVVAIHKKEVLNYGKRIDFFQLGKQDASKHYGVGGSIAAGVISGLFGPFGVIPVVAILLKKPKLSYKTNPNAFVYEVNDSYKEGYLKKARKKKMIGATSAFVITGSIITIVTIQSIRNINYGFTW
jgi:hypothetical protein